MKITNVESLHADAGHPDLVTVRPEIKEGHLTLPTGPGWGTEVNEEAVRAHPPRRR